MFRDADREAAGAVPRGKGAIARSRAALGARGGRRAGRSRRTRNATPRLWRARARTPRRIRSTAWSPPTSSRLSTRLDPRRRTVRAQLRGALGR